MKYLKDVRFLYRVCSQDRLSQILTNGSRSITTNVASALNFVNGQRKSPKDSNSVIDVTEPATGKRLCNLKSSGRKDVEEAVAASQKAFRIWSQTPARERGRVLYKTSQNIKKYLNEIVYLEVKDCGKPSWEAKEDILACADAFEYYAGMTSAISGSYVQLPQGNFALIKKVPLGVCGGIGAWNFPFLIASWKAAPALACGNSMIFKPSPLTPLTAVTLAEILQESGLPPGVFNVLQGDGITGQLLCESPGIEKVSFTGGIETGIKVMSACSSTIKYVTLELGGKSPLIIFDDCNMENAIKAALMGNFLSQGQVCTNATRVFIQNTIKDEFLEKLVKATKTLKVGDPFKSDTKIGATISKQHADKIIHYIEQAKLEGAKVLCGGERLTLSDPNLKGGQYLSPCILSNCRDNMTVVKEEIFGAVLSALEFDTEEEVIDRANNTPFGLAGGVMTSDLARAHRVADQIEAGFVWINNYNLYPPEIPFGGFKMSGIGRENGEAILDHYTQTKTVMVEMNDVDCPLL